MDYLDHFVINISVVSYCGLILWFSQHPAIRPATDFNEHFNFLIRVSPQLLTVICSEHSKLDPVAHAVAGES